MASNPMQRKARNSFLLGVFITMLISALIIGFLLWRMFEQREQEQETELAQTTVYVLMKDVTSGSSVSIADLKQVAVTKDAVSLSSLTSENFLTAVTENSLYKINLKAGTILSTDMIAQAEDITQDDTREQEYNMIVLPTYLEIDNYIDVRLRLPSGEDYIVVSKKKVTNADENTMWIRLSEDEILTLSNAIVEAYQIDGALLYATTYVEPGIQAGASVTYVPTMSVSQLINSNPNVIQTAKEELAKRYNNSTLYSGRTNVIDPAVGAAGEQAQTNVSTGTATSIETQKESRSNYIKELEAATLTTTE